MCGISCLAGSDWKPEQLDAMMAAQHHRGPDDTFSWISPDGWVGLGQNRLSIIDLSPAGRQPMPDSTNRYWIALNGEIYNYLELRRELPDYPFHSRTDTEVVLAAFTRWGPAILDRLIGMFAFVIWDTQEKRLFAARDRFGVKPLYFHLRLDGTICMASEIKAIFATGFPAEPDETAWATYLGKGFYDHTSRTFWRGIFALPGGHVLTWQEGHTEIRRWYDLADRTKNLDQRKEEDVEEEYQALMMDSVKFRFRSDVPVGINLSGGLDSSALLGVVRAVQGEQSSVKAFTFISGDSHYDELPWVEQMLAHTQHPSVVCVLSPAEVPDLALSVQRAQDEPYSGLPTLAYARLFETARQEGVIVLLDGNGMDEQWAGYDYYETVLQGGAAGMVQGTKDSPIRADCLMPEFVTLAENFISPQPYSDRLRDYQYRDAIYTKIPRALRFNDRISMRASCELREPFLDHRLFELAMRQPADRKIRDGERKWLMRRITGRITPEGIARAPKRPVQTPQREWLRGPLKAWAKEHIENAISALDKKWLDGEAVRRAWENFLAGNSDNSFYIWEWISLSMMGIKP